MSKRKPYPAHLAFGYPYGIKADRRMIVKCSEPEAWYKNMIGEVITVHFFATFGAYDTRGRWIWYYDLGAPIPSIWQRIKSSLKRLFGK